MIVHIVPTVPPDLNGLADYCFKLSQNWPDASASWGCVALHVPAGAKERWPQARFENFEPSQQGLIAALDDFSIDTLVVHYVGYAYHPRGVPRWLPPALKQWKKAHPQQRLVVMFHELWAGGAPWRSCFWVMPTAKSIVAKLAEISDSWITSSQYYFDKVVSVGGNASHGAVIPIATPVEPVSPVDFLRNWPLSEGGKLKIAVFGLASTRNAALSIHAGLLSELCRQDLVERISLLGRSPQDSNDREKSEAITAQIGHPALWHSAYDLSPAEVSNLLREHDVGIVKETATLLTKSSVFAALCSHGVIPVCAGKDAADEDASSPFLINSDVQKSVLALQNPEVIAAKKRNIQNVATTALNWSLVAQKWMHHIESKK